jgi:hypothetical protein
MAMTQPEFRRALLKSFIVAAIGIFPMVAEATATKGAFIHNEFVNPRALGMGNTFSAVDDYAAIFYHPAAMAWMKEGNLNLGIQAGGTPPLVPFINNVSAAAGSSENKEQKTIDVLVAAYGKTYGVRAAPLGLIWSRPNWGIAFIPADLSGYFSVHRKVGPQLVADIYNDSTLAFGMSKKYGEYFSAGFNTRLVYRAHTGQDILALNLVSDSNFIRLSDVREGMTVDADVSAIYRPPIPGEGFFSFFQLMKPQFSIAARNLVDAGFSDSFKLYGKDTSTRPPQLQRRLDIGSTWQLPEFWFFRPRWALDIRNFGHLRWSFKKGLHTGVELEGSPWAWLKGALLIGLNQGYWTAGWLGQLGWFRIELVSYGEEMGVAGAESENRNAMARLSLDF